uniref:NAD(P)H-dependent oxidoreductase n=1 Tax=Streptomyces sp. NBC_00049 TaxID=2903617 RepID=A0AAU2JXB5_9ACTN
MKTMVIFNHPYEGSYCAAVREAVVAGLKRAQADVDVLHLDQEGFNPVMTTEELAGFSQGVAYDPKVLDYQARIADSDHLVFIFPIWWELMPALTKGFMDKVLLKGFAYEEVGPPPRFVSRLPKVKSVTLITTMTIPQAIYRFYFGNAIKKAFFTGGFKKIGIKKTKWISLPSVKSVSQEKREKWLSDIENQFAQLT